MRREIYDQLVAGRAMPKREALASALKAGRAAVAESLMRLADAHMLVLQRDGEILMANPFSAVPTSFAVTSGDASWDGNCIWDSMGIAAMIGRSATIEASCGCYGTAMTIGMPDGCVADERPAHFAIPAARWWDDIVFS